MTKFYRLIHPFLFLFPFFLITFLILVTCRDLTSLKKSNTDPVTTASVQAEHYYSVPISPWKDVIIYAHGYVNPTTPGPTIPDDKIGGRYIGDLINSLGFAFATTSYPGNGLVVPAAVPDIKKLADQFKAKFPQTEHVYLVGVSEGGLITAKVIETYPNTFTGGIAGCGPVGDFEKQLDYFGNFQVLFHYFYPNIDIGTPDRVPDSLITSWVNGGMKTEIQSRIDGKILPLLKVAEVPIDNLTDAKQTVLGLLRYNLLATNDAVNKLGGYPFDNRRIFYHGTGIPQKDIVLNSQIPRFRADSTALNEINSDYQTTGKLTIPLVTIHNTGDPIVPYFHERLYEKKIEQEGSTALHKNIALNSYGHCNFNTSDLLAAFSALLKLTGKQKLVVSKSIFPNNTELQNFLKLSKTYGVKPAISSSDQISTETFIHGTLSSEK